MTENTITNTKGYRDSLKDSPAWAVSYGVTEKLAKKFNVKNMAEIGVARGHHSAHLLEAIPDISIYSIDPWGLYLDEHKAMYSYHTLKDDEKIYQNVVDMLKPFSERSTIIRSTSERAINEIPGILDMIFIDADHSYASVKKDIGLWWDKVKPNGIISGHDYNHSAHPGVTKAVDEYFGSKGLTINKEVGHVWWVQKPEELLSFIIPTYNSINFLEETVNSIFNQNLKIPFEVIISDDCSNDKTQELIKKLSNKHPEIKYFLNEKNRYAPANRNFAISNCKGNLIYMLDHDNVLEPDSINILIDTINKRGCGAASFQELHFFKNNIQNHKGSWIFKYPENLFTIKEFITFPNSPAASNNYMYTRSAFEKTGGYPERGARENMGFGLRLLATGTSIAIAPKTKYYHRIVENSMWLEENNKNPEKSHKNMSLNFREFIDLFDKKSQGLINSPEAEKIADTFIAKRKLKLSDKGWELAGGKNKYKFIFPVFSILFSSSKNWLKKKIEKYISIIKKVKLEVLKISYIKQLFIFYQTTIKNENGVLKKIILYKNFMADFNKYQKININNNFIISKKLLKPCIFDKTNTTPLDPTYFYQDTWCAKKIFDNKPSHHYDIGSQAEMVGIISQFTLTTMIDIRPIGLKLPNLNFIESNILSLPFSDNSLESISSICVIEHIGLGRYGDTLNSNGSEEAISEIIRVLAVDGNLYISLPIDKKNNVYFNAHRSFTREYILELFSSLSLVEEKYIYKKEMVNNYDAAKGFGTGLFHFKKLN